MAQVSLKDITGPLLSVLLLLAGASPAAAQINHSPAGERGRHPDRSAAGAVPSRPEPLLRRRRVDPRTGGLLRPQRQHQLHRRLGAAVPGPRLLRLPHRRPPGDPRPGCTKDYQARYMCRDGGNERYASASPEASGQSVVLDCRRQ